MNASDLFGVVVRTAGFLIIVRSLWGIASGVLTVLTTTMPTFSGETDYWPLPMFLLQIAALLFGVVCFFAADRIVAASYGNHLQSQR